MPKNKEDTPQPKYDPRKSRGWKDLRDMPEVLHLLNGMMLVSKKPKPPHYPSDMSPGTRISGGSDLDQW